MLQKWHGLSQDNKVKIFCIVLVALFSVLGFLGKLLVDTTASPPDPKLENEPPKPDRSPIALSLSGVDAIEGEIHVINFKPPNIMATVVLKNTGDKLVEFEEHSFPKDKFYLTLWERKLNVPAHSESKFSIILINRVPEHHEYPFELTYNNKRDKLKITIRVTGNWHTYFTKQLDQFQNLVSGNSSPIDNYEAARTVIGNEYKTVTPEQGEIISGQFLARIKQSRAAAIAFSNAEQTQPKVVESLVKELPVVMALARLHETKLDYSKAAKWYRIGVMQSDAAAHYTLGSLYWDGRGVPKDNQKATRLLNKAKALGYNDSEGTPTIKGTKEYNDTNGPSAGVCVSSDCARTTGPVLTGTRNKRQELKDCAKFLKRGFLKVPDERDKRFLGKVRKDTANCRGGAKALKYRDTPWVDWTNYWATGDASTKAEQRRSFTPIGKHLRPNGRGVDGALTDLEYQRVELIKFNLFDNQTFEEYVKGSNGVPGRSVKQWDATRLPQDHPDYAAVGGSGKQLCKGELIRHRTLTGICNDIKNPLMGSTNQPFARNVQFEATFPRLGRTKLVKNRHGDRLGLLKPDPQVISRKLFTRKQSRPESCKQGYGDPGNPDQVHCDYKPAPFFNVLAAYWIQFMTHDWFSHLREGQNTGKMMKVGCTSQKINNVETPLTEKDVKTLQCRPQDQIDGSLYAETEEAGTFKHKGKTYLKRAPHTTANTVTAWWDASQLYGYDETSRKRVKRDPKDLAKMLLVKRGKGSGPGYLPVFETCDEGQDNCIADPIHPAWAGQEAVAFPDNWSIGLSFYHNVFAREHNAFVDEFRKRAKRQANTDSGLRNPADPKRVITYKQVSDDELFEAARLVVSAEIAKIHTIEWTTQLLYDEPLYLGMNSNWYGLLKDYKLVSAALDKVVHHGLARSRKEKAATSWYSVFASGPGIFGLGNDLERPLIIGGKSHRWDLTNPDDVNGGINHFGSPFNFPEEFTSVYRLHTMIPDVLEYREVKSPNQVKEKITVFSTFRDDATSAMDSRGLANWALSMGRQRLGLLFLQNHPQFLQNLRMEKRLHGSPTQKIDVVALDLIRDRERGVPRFNEFRRQYGLKTLTGFDNFIDRHVAKNSPQYKDQVELVSLLREVYGQHRCDASKIITVAQLNEDGSPINDCLGHPDGSMVDNVEDLDNVVGWLAETTRPHGFAISETQFHVFILNASRRLFSDRFFTSSFRPEFYTSLGVDWVNDNGPTGKIMEKGEPNGHEQQVSTLKRVLLRTMPELSKELSTVVNAFDPWARDRGEYYSLEWKPRPDAKSDPAF